MSSENVNLYQNRESRFSKSKTVVENRTSLMNDSKFSETGSISVERRVFHFKVILLGEIAVGKSAILNRFVDNKYDNEYKCTISVECKTKSLILDELTAADLQIWDTCGEERFRSITKSYYNNTEGAILIFDLTNKSSFDKIPQWIDDLSAYAPKDLSLLIIGNKSDQSEQRVISFNDAFEFTNKRNIPYIEVSAKTGSNVVLIYCYVFDKYWVLNN